MQRPGRVQGEQQRRGDQQRQRAQRGPQRRVGQGGQEQRHRGDAEHRERSRTPAPGRCAKPAPAGSASCRETVVRPPPRPSAEQQPARRRRPCADHQHGHEHEGHHGDQLGHQQPGPAHRPDQQVAQRAGLGLAGDRVAGQIATAIGRNSGSTIANAARGNSVPSVSTADRNAGPVPGRGPRSVIASSTATRVGSGRSAGDRHPGPRPPHQLAQLDPDRSSRLAAGLEVAPLAAHASAVASSTTSLQVAAARPELGRPGRPAPTSRRSAPPGRRRGPAAGRPVDADSTARRAAHAPGRRPACAPRPGRSAAAARPAAPAAPAGRGRGRRPGCTSARPRRAGGWTGRSWCRRRCSSSSSSRISRMPCGSRPLVGSSSTSSRGRAQQRRGQPEPLPHAQRVRPHRPAVDAGQPDLLQRVVDPRPRRWPPRRRPGRRRPAARGWPARTGAGTPPAPRPARPTCGSTRRAAARHRPAEHLDLARASASTRPSSIRTVVVLPEPLAPRKP